MTDLKSLVFYLSLHVLFQAQSSAAYQYVRPYDYDLRISPLPVTGTAPSQTATPVVHSSENKWQYHGEYSWYFPQETSTPINGHHTSHSRPHATGAHTDTRHENHGLHPSPTRETRAPYPSHSAIRPSYSAINTDRSSPINNSTSKAVVLPSTKKCSSAVYHSSSAPSSRASASISHGELRGTTIERVTLVPTPLNQPPRWVTKRTVSSPSQPAQEPSTSTTSSTKTSSTKTSSTKTSSTKTSSTQTSSTQTSSTKTSSIKTSSTKTSSTKTSSTKTSSTKTSSTKTSSTQTSSTKTSSTKTSSTKTSPTQTSSTKTSSTKTSSTKTSSTESAAKPIPPPTCLSGKFYTVVSGDTCTKIAAQQNVPVGKLISQNKLPSTCNNLQIGQKLCVPQCKSYIVQPGDFCFKITQNFNVELSDFYAANPEINSGCTNLPLGGLVCIPEPAKN